MLRRKEQEVVSLTVAVPQKKVGTGEASIGVAAVVMAVVAVVVAVVALVETLIDTTAASTSSTYMS